MTVFLVAAINLVTRGPDAFTGARVPALPFDKLGSGIAGANWSPVFWTSRGVTALARGDLGAGLLWIAPVLALGLVLPPLLAAATERAYLTGYQRNRATGSRRRRSRTDARRRWQGTPPAWVLIATKDLRQLRRDPSQVGQLLLPLVLFAFYLGRPGAAIAGSGALPGWFMVSLTACFASLLFASNVALRGVGVEGGGAWVLLEAPFPKRQLLIAKYVVGFIVSVVPAMLLFWIGELRSHASIVDIAFPSLRLLVVIAGVVAIATGLGAMSPKLNWTDPRRAVSIWLTLLYLACATTYIVAMFIVLGTPYAFGGSAVGAIVGADVVLALTTAGVAAVVLRAGQQRLQTLEP